MSDLKAASKEKRNHSHSVIDEAIARNAQVCLARDIPSEEYTQA